MSAGLSWYEQKKIEMAMEILVVTPLYMDWLYPTPRCAMYPSPEPVKDPAQTAPAPSPAHAQVEKPETGRVA